MTAIIPDQRKYSLTEALAIAQDEADKNDIGLKFIEKGKCGKSTTRLATIACAANDHKRKMSFMGGGSGDGLKANVKAAYEALEDALAHQAFSTISPDKIFSFSTRSSPSVSYLQHLGLYPDLLSQPEYMRHDFPWLKLSDINHKLDDMYYPLSLIYPYTTKIPHYNHPVDQSDLTELSNETSISIGASYEEAVIHALNEWIERDAYALFLLNTIVRKNGKPIRIICSESLPEDLKIMVETIEYEFDERLIIVDITSDINIPAFLVSFSRQRSLVQPAGFSASLSKHAALEQALLEALQYKHRYNAAAEEFRQDILLHYQQQPLLIKAMQCDLQAVMTADKYTYCRWDSIPAYTLNTLADQIKLMSRLLSHGGFEIYYTDLYRGESGVSLVYVLVTGLERFFLIKDGKFIPPGLRGRMAME